MVDKTKVEKEAKEILDKFALALEKVRIDESDFHFSQKEFERIEGEGVECEGFKNKLLENAPQHDEDFVIAERGGWK